MSNISVVILNYKLKELTLKCLKSVQSSDYPNLNIIVVDNNSGDGLQEKIVNDKEITFIQTGDNLGYSGGNNIGIKKALELGADYIFILNPDAIVKKDTISILQKTALDSNSDILGPKVYFEDEKTIWYAGSQFDLANVLGNHRGVDEIDSGQYDQIEETDGVTGAAMFVKADVFKKIGSFDERYFLYYEDADFCYRAKQAGLKITYVPQAVVIHKNAQSTGLGTPLQDYYITRNRMLFASKFLSFRTRFALLREAIKNINIPARKKALLDFLMGNFGKRWQTK